MVTFLNVCHICILLWPSLCTILLGIVCQNGRLLHRGDHNPYVEARRDVNMVHHHSDMEACDKFYDTCVHNSVVFHTPFHMRRHLHGMGCCGEPRGLPYIFCWSTSCKEGIFHHCGTYDSLDDGKHGSWSKASHTQEVKFHMELVGTKLWLHNSTLIRQSLQQALQRVVIHRTQVVKKKWQLQVRLSPTKENRYWRFTLWRLCLFSVVKSKLKTGSCVCFCCHDIIPSQCTEEYSLGKPKAIFWRHKDFPLRNHRAVLLRCSFPQRLDR